MKFSACIEMLFVNETDSHAERIKLAREAGLDAVEFWRWVNKDIDIIEQALKDNNIKLAAMIAEPMLDLTKQENIEPYLNAIDASVKTAQRLGANILIAQSGNRDISRSFHDQRSCLVQTLQAVGKQLEGTGVKLALEPLNTRYDHPGYFLNSTVEALDIIDEVNSANIGLLYDVYHSMVMDEHPATVIGNRVDRILHIHIADHPGRNEPGSGILDLKTSLNWLADNGYNGLIGLEYRPTKATTKTLDKIYNILK
ncbi:MAG: hydroxypyruvate isomerase [Hyphomicrobiales bacterium]|nr:MAG: hydroxypyruvate isomerase [Hyphomicrobiales bacterium]